MCALWRQSLSVCCLAVLVLVAALVMGSARGEANWLTKILKETGEAGGDGGTKASRLGLGGLGDAAGVLRRLPEPGPGKLAFAAHATPAGHWRFVNREGAVFTAATPDEMGRVAKALAPEAEASSVPSLYLSEESVFKRPQLIDDLPKPASLHLAFGDQAFPLLRRGGGEAASLLAQLRPNLFVAIGTRAQFTESVWQLGRRLPREKIRVLSLKPGGASGLAGLPRFDKARGLPLADEIDPAKLAKALPGIRGQTAVVTGRIEGDLLYVLPSSGAERAVLLGEIRAAASRADINFIVLQSSRPLQPGGQNWLWQTIELDGLRSALAKSTVADFLQALVGKHGRFVVSSNETGPGRVRFDAVPDNAGGDFVDSVGKWVGDAVSEVAGNVVTESVSAFMTSSDRRQELDERIIPGIPSSFQFYYLGALVMGLLGFGVAKSWWDGIWPREQRSEYRGVFGYGAAFVVRWAAFILIFLPVVGPFALLGALVIWLGYWLMLPVRVLRRMLGFGSV
ncbi:MAG: hypothetical protein K0U74_13020 [Alphaproteobacteria bacterium]|nr:hypothetical protein [Alphaproteobacteria bacterium]